MGEEKFEQTALVKAIDEFSRFGIPVIEGKFDGGSMTSDAGVMLLSETDRKLGPTKAGGTLHP